MSATLQKKLKARHLSMIALGGSIGAGLFVASGSTIAGAGPGGAVLAYLLIGVMVYFLMTSVGEMAVYNPHAGAFSTYARKYVDPSFGFVVGWNYWYNGVATLAFGLSAGSLLMQFWFPQIPTWVFSAIFLIVITFLNIISVRGYGESEFWFASIKVFAVIIFLIVGTFVIFTNTEQIHAAQNWTFQDAPFHNGFAGFISVCLVAGFSFHGTEIVAVASAESENPKTDIPKAINSVFFRILIFYVLTMIIIGSLVPFNDPNLMIDDNISASPFTLAFSKINLPFAASIMNLVVLTAVLSMSNSVTYASTRTLYDMSNNNLAPKMFAKLTKNKIPINSVILSIIAGGAALLSSVFGDDLVYTWLLNLSALSGFFNWIAIAISHYRFRRSFLAQNKDLKELPYRAKLFPFGPILAFGLSILIIIGQDYDDFVNGTLNVNSLLACYIGIPVFILIYLLHRFIFKTRLIKLENIDLGVE